MALLADPLTVTTRTVYCLPAVKTVNSADVASSPGVFVTSFPLPSSNVTMYDVRSPAGATHFTFSEVVVIESITRPDTEFGSAMKNKCVL